MGRNRWDTRLGGKKTKQTIPTWSRNRPIKPLKWCLLQYLGHIIVHWSFKMLLCHFIKVCQTFFYVFGGLLHIMSNVLTLKVMLDCLDNLYFFNKRTMMLLGKDKCSMLIKKGETFKALNTDKCFVIDTEMHKSSVNKTNITFIISPFRKPSILNTVHSDGTEEY